MPANEPSAPSHTSAEAVEIIRRLLGMIDDGEIDADTPQARRMVRRLEGAEGAWEADWTREVRAPSRADPFDTHLGER